MVKRDELIKFIYSVIGRDLLEKTLKVDEMLNGVQILGAETTEKICMGVSLNEEFLKKAVEVGSNFCVFHHGLDARTYKSRIPLSSQKRLRLIFKNDITIVGFHYALDAHKEIGNNATIIKKLGGRIVDTLYEEWGFVAELPSAISIRDLAHKCEDLFDHDIFVVETARKKVKRIGVVSGGAKPYFENIAEMEEKGVELFITGESSESVPHKMQESEINYFSCGHYATEVFGVTELGKRIKDQFKDKVDVQFIDIENPI